MELREYYTILVKWWWLFVLCALFGGGAAYLVSGHLQPVYEASTIVMVGGSLDVVNPTTGELQTSEKLAQTYAELIKTRPILSAAESALNLPHQPRVTVTLVRSTQLMRITVEDSIPTRAAATADELALQLIKQSPSASQRQEESYREVVTRQLAALESEMEMLSRFILSEQDAGNREEVERLQQELNARRANYALLLSYLKSGSTNYIRVIEPAQIPQTPIRPKVAQNTLLAAVTGLMLASGIAFLIEYLDDTIKPSRYVEQVLQVPALGSIIRLGKRDNADLISLQQPLSPTAEAYRMIRTNLRYSLPNSDGPRSFLVTSAEPGVGKTTVIANLAIVMAQAGQRVVLVQADLRRPRLHKVFNCTNDVGLTSILVGEVQNLDAALQPTAVTSLRLLPGGPIPPNAAELLDSPQMAKLFKALSERADVILLDSPPVLAVADASILSRLVSGTLFVVKAGQTRYDIALRSLDVLNRAGAKLLGVVLNSVEMHSRGNGSSYHYYYQEYQAEEPDAPVGRRRKPRKTHTSRHSGRERRPEERLKALPPV